MKWVKWILYSVFLSACLIVGAGARLVANVVDAVGGGNTSVLKVIKTMQDPKSVFPAGTSALTILLVGQDYNHDKKGILYTKNSRADTIMLLRVNLDSKEISACSIPRDTYVTAADQVSGKINATLPRGGIDLLKRTLEQQFSITIDNYVVIKPYAVREIVDEIGGVDVEALDKMKYDDNWGGLHVDIAAGQHHLNGIQAEGFVRYRHPNSGEKLSKEDGDLRRAARQQLMVKSLMGAANSPGNIVHADEIIDAGFKQIDTDLDRIKLFALAQLFRGEAMQKMKSATVPGDDDSSTGVYYYKLDYERSRATIDWLIKGDDTAMRRLVRIEIRNGTKTPGLARVAADMLTTRGYTAKAPGNAPSVPVTTIVYRKASFEEAARDVQQALGATTITKEVKLANDWDPEIKIVIGEDLKEKLKPAGT